MGKEQRDKDEKRKAFLAKFEVFEKKTDHKFANEETLRKEKEQRAFQKRLQKLIADNPGVSPTILEYRLTQGIDTPLESSNTPSKKTEAPVTETEEGVALESGKSTSASQPDAPVSSQKDSITVKRAAIAGGVKLFVMPVVSVPKIKPDDEMYGPLLSLANGNNVWQVSLDSFLCIVDSSCYPADVASSSSSDKTVKIGDKSMDRPKGQLYIVSDSDIWEENEGTIPDTENGGEKTVIFYESTNVRNTMVKKEDKPDGVLVIIEE